MKRTEVCILLDRSGSMGEIKDYVIQGYNEHVQQIKADAEEQKGENEYFVSLVTFTGKVYEHLWRVPASELQEANAKDYVPDGSTALYDAQGYVLEKYLEETDTNDPEASYLIIVITDGKNMKTMQHTLESVRELTKSAQAKGNFTITYMGCDGEYLREYAASTGVSLGNCAVWAPSAGGARVAMAESRGKLRKYSDDRKMGLRAATNFHNEGSEFCMADYTSPVAAPLSAPEPSLPFPSPLDMGTSVPATSIYNQVIAEAAAEESAGYFATGKMVIDSTTVVKDGNRWRTIRTNK